MHLGLDLQVKILVLGDGAADDERGARLIDEDAVHLVHDGVVKVALHQLVGRDGHVVAQIVEAEFAVHAVGHIAEVCLTAFFKAHTGGDAAHGEAVEVEDGAHPLGVARCQIVVHRHQMRAASNQGVEKEGQGGNQGLALSGGHLGDLAVMQCHAADQLNIEGHHVPHGFMLAHHKALPQQAAAGVLHDGEDLGQIVVQGGFGGFFEVFAQFVDVVVQPRAFALVGFLAILTLQVLQFITQGLQLVRQFPADLLHPLPQLIVVILLQARADLVDLLDHGQVQIHFLGVFIAKQLAEYLFQHLTCPFPLPFIRRENGVSYL